MILHCKHIFKTHFKSVSFFFIQFRVATELCLSESGDVGCYFPREWDLSGVSNVLQWTYMIVAVSVLLLSMIGAKPERCISIWVHRGAFFVFGLLSLGTIFLTSAYILTYGSVVLKTSLLASFSTYFVVGIVHGELHHVIATLLFYLFALPSFINIFQMYSMCNLHDVSWGTRPAATEDMTSNKTNTNSTNYGSTMNRTPEARIRVRSTSSTALNHLLSDEDGDDLNSSGSKSLCCCGGRDSCNDQQKTKIADIQHDFMLKTVFLWIITNMGLIMMTEYAVGNQDLFMTVAMTLLFSIMIIRLFGSMIYACSRYCCCPCRSPYR